MWCPCVPSSDTLATLRSKVEAQKLAVEATNSRLQSLRQPPEPSDLCLYPLPEGKAHVNLAGSLVIDMAVLFSSQ